MSSSDTDDAASVTWNAGDVDLRHLRIIVALGEHENIPAAARSLKLTSANAAAQLRSAERALSPMFLAGGSVLQPTTRGVVAVRRARAVLESMKSLERRLSRTDQWQRGIRVAAVTLPFELILPMPREELPGLDWTVRAAPSPAAGMASVADGDADLVSGMIRIDDRPGLPCGRRGLAVGEMLHEPAGVRLLAAPQPPAVRRARHTRGAPRRPAAAAAGGRRPRRGRGTGGRRVRRGHRAGADRTAGVTAHPYPDSGWYTDELVARPDTAGHEITTGLRTGRHRRPHGDVQA